MDTSIIINRIIRQISTLDYQAKIQVAEKILSMIKTKDKKQKSHVKLTDLKGLGSDIWKNIDIDNYIDNERQWA